MSATPRPSGKSNKIVAGAADKLFEVEDQEDGRLAVSERGISDLSSHVEPAGWRGALQQVEGRLLAVLRGTCDWVGGRVSAGELG